MLGLAARILSQPRLEDVPHDALVEIDGCERLGIIVIFLLDLRFIHVPEDIGTAGADGGADLRPEPGPADGFPDDQCTQIDGPYILERSAETADGGPGPAYDDNVSHAQTVSFLSLHPDQHRVALGGAGADAADAQASAPPPELVGEGHQDPRPRRPDGVAVGDGAAVHVDLREHLLLRHPQDRPGADEDDRGEGLVDLDQVDPVEGQVVLLQDLPDGEPRHRGDVLRRLGDLGVIEDRAERR